MLLPPALFDFFAYVAEIIFIKVSTFQWDGIPCFRIVIDIVIPSTPFKSMLKITFILSHPAGKNQQKCEKELQETLPVEKFR